MSAPSQEVIRFVSRAWKIALDLPNNQGKSIHQMRAEAAALFGADNVKAAINSPQQESKQ